MPQILEYAQPKAPRKSLAVAALVVSLCSGPVVLVMTTVAPLLALATVLGVLVFACIVRFRLRSHAGAGLRLMADLAIAAPIMWGLSIIAFFVYALSRV